MGSREVTLPTPRCPFCECVMQEVQLKVEQDPFNPLRVIPQEVWCCDSCHTNHIFPARVEFLIYVGRSELLPLLHRVEHLPI